MDLSQIYRRALGCDRPAYAWQVEFANNEWPRVLVAPTGSGKTAAVTLGWAVHRLTRPTGTPRRLVWCLPMRTLVEQTAEKAKEWFGKLAAIDDSKRLPTPEDVHVLMGGTTSTEWLLAPERPAVVVGTQDMLLSRALMRGYASSRAIWPMEFALLHEDAQWVFDEVQLMGAGRATSAQLEAFRRDEAARAAEAGVDHGRPARSLWLSATLDPSWLTTVDHPPPTSVVTIDPTDPGATRDSRLAELASATKKLHRCHAAPASPTKTNLNTYVRELADEVLEKHRAGKRTIAIVNRVDRAQALHEAIKKQIAKPGQSAPTLALVHSRFRPADRQREMEKVTADTNSAGQIVVATQAIEAGVDISAAVMFTEIAPWSSMIQRFGRANRYAEVADGADVHWIDLLYAASDKDAEKLALPYTAEELRSGREHLAKLTDVASVRLPAPDLPEPPCRVIRRKDLDDLFDTDPDLTGFVVDISPYVRDTDDTDIRVFWRDLSDVGDETPPPAREEICAVPIGSAREWLRQVRKRANVQIYQRDPQWRRKDGRSEATPPGWMAFRDQPWPGLMLLADRSAGGYSESTGFTGDPKHVPNPVAGPDSPTGPQDGVDGPPVPIETEGHDEDQLSQIDAVVSLADHLRHVEAEADGLCAALDIDGELGALVTRAARWHDLGKAHEVFQETMRRGLDDRDVPSAPLAKTVGRVRHSRPYFRHELASALAFLAHEGWSRDADLIAYLIAAHHGKVRMNLRALPRERAPDGERAGSPFARGIWSGDELPQFDLEGGDHWPGGRLHLSIMELGWDEATHESWTERTRELLARIGPFRLAWMETLLRIADWRASGKEREGSYDAR